MYSRFRIFFLLSVFYNEYCWSLFKECLPVLSDKSFELVFLLSSHNSFEHVNFLLKKDISMTIYVPFSKKYFKKYFYEERFLKLLSKKSNNIFFPNNIDLPFSDEQSFIYGQKILDDIDLVFYFGGEVESMTFQLACAALDKNILLITYPGNIYSNCIHTNNLLIEMGAKSVISNQNILEILPAANLHDILKQ